MQRQPPVRGDDQHFPAIISPRDQSSVTCQLPSHEKPKSLNVQVALCLGRWYIIQSYNHGGLCTEGHPEHNEHAELCHGLIWFPVPR